jgi:CHAD domain-containing protein
MPHFEQFIEVINPNDSVHAVAQHSLRVRLAAVSHYLSSAAEKSGEDKEYVHELRVFTRRSMAALTLYAGLLPKKAAKELRKTLRKIRNAAGVARDLDVLAHSHESDTGEGAHAFLEDVRLRRQAAQKPIVAIHRKLKRKNSFRHQVDTLLEKTNETDSHSAAGSFGRWATARLRKILKRFFKASPSNLHDLRSLHRFRIRGKELRYAMELLAPAYPAAFRMQLYPVVEELQERLGEIHDHAVAKTCFEKWIIETKSKREVVHVRKLLGQERGRLDTLVANFVSWWTPELEANLRESFQRLSTDRQHRLPRKASRREHSDQARERHKTVRPRPVCLGGHGSRA